jgi:hypothetical protein
MLHFSTLAVVLVLVLLRRRPAELKLDLKNLVLDVKL